MEKEKKAKEKPKPTAKPIEKKVKEKKVTIPPPKKPVVTAPPPPPKPKLTRVDLEKQGEAVALAILDFKGRSPKTWSIVNNTFKKGLTVDAAITLMHNMDATLTEALSGVSKEKVQEALKKACECES